MSLAMALDPVDAPAATECTGLFEQYPGFNDRPFATFSPCNKLESFGKLLLPEVFLLDSKRQGNTA
jgi:hypothetical protein|tara:strand:- start:86 stop:283 length:198 start_codon:yes stop_codon:yes gene_type:complete